MLKIRKVADLDLNMRSLLIFSCVITMFMVAVPTVFFTPAKQGFDKQHHKHMVDAVKEKKGQNPNFHNVFYGLKKLLHENNFNNEDWKMIMHEDLICAKRR